MSEIQEAVAALTRELTALGVRSDRDLLVHSSMRRVGHVVGGTATVLSALRRAIGPDSTLVVPAQTQGNSLTSKAFQSATAGLSGAELAEYIAAMPGFDPLTSPSAGMGILAEAVRRAPGAARSAHPQSSFAAIGRRSAECMAGHEMSCHLGERSPLGWLYRQDADVLLLGVGYGVCTAFHLAEYRLPAPVEYRQYRCFTMTDGIRTEHRFTDLRLIADDFEVLGGQLDSLSFVRHGRVGEADCRLLPIRRAVDFALLWPPFARRRRPDPVHGEKASVTAIEEAIR